MSLETRAYDKPNDHGFPPDPVVVLVATGTHDVSRLVHLLNGASPNCEHVALGQQVVAQVRRHNAGRAALALLKAHGGPDFDQPDKRDIEIARLRSLVDDLTNPKPGDDDYCSGDLSFDGRHTSDFRKRGFDCVWCGAVADDEPAPAVTS